MRAGGSRTQVLTIYAGWRLAHPGDVLTKFLTLVFLSVRDTATTLETLFQLSAYQKNRLAVQRMKPINGRTHDGRTQHRCTPTKLLLRQDCRIVSYTLARHNSL
jgi:hypothetical protein